MKQLRRYARLKNFWLFLCLSSFFLVYPLVSTLGVGSWALDILLTGAILFAIQAQTNLGPIARSIYFLVGAGAVALNWTDTLVVEFAQATSFLYAVFFGISLMLFCHRLFMQEKLAVDADTVLAAACAYFVLGLFFTSLYLVVLGFDPNAIAMEDGGALDPADAFYSMIYFSFVTMTTLGYGDVLPISNIAKMLATYEAVIGQIFITVVIAEFVGLHISNRKQ